MLKNNLLSNLGKYLEAAYWADYEFYHKGNNIIELEYLLDLSLQCVMRDICDEYLLSDYIIYNKIKKRILQSVGQFIFEVAIHDQYERENLLNKWVEEILNRIDKIIKEDNND